jgi:hypothetical protein
MIKDDFIDAVAKGAGAMTAYADSVSSASPATSTTSTLSGATGWAGRNPRTGETVMFAATTRRVFPRVRRSTQP